VVGRKPRAPEVDVRAGRCAEQDYLKPLTAPDQLRQIECRGNIGDMPATRLLEKRQLQAFAAQRALVDDCKVAPNRADKAIARTVRKLHLVLAEMIQSIQVSPSPTGSRPAAENGVLASPSG